MNWQQDRSGESQEFDHDLEQALGHFKASMDAWSSAALSRPQTVTRPAVRHTWRLAAGWALGCVVVMGSLAGAAHEIYHRQELAKLAAQKAAQKAAEQRTAAAQPTSAQSDKKTSVATIRKVSAGAQDSASMQDEDLLASVDSDVSREVPAAMEPLAQLMEDNGTQ
jgi:hypothetical protein